MTEKYKVWMTIEKITLDEDGEEEYEDMSEFTISLGEYSSYKCAADAMVSAHDLSFKPIELKKDET